MILFKNWSYVFIFTMLRDETYMVKCFSVDSGEPYIENCIAIIKFRCNHCMNHCLSCSLIDTASDLEDIFQRLEVFLCDISNMLF